ncbi:MAG: hypothetical protein MUO57_14015 [Anaerolineales bacterium]|nr:hypothetical protein [Anaerolineales bacterium]
MQSDIKKALKAPWDRIKTLNLEGIPLLTASEQTKGSWAKEIETIHRVPEIYKEFYDEFLDKSSDFPYSVITPTFNGFIHRENEKLICIQNNNIFILENVNNKLLRSCYAIGDINYVEFGTILLKAWIRITGLVDSGILSSSTLRFNSVTEYMFYPFVNKIRSAANNPSRFGKNSELSKFDYLSEVNFKFMNYARNSVLPEENIIDHVFQPEIHSTLFTLFGKNFYRTISTTHIGILTDKELIIIQDTGGGRMNNNKRFGGIKYYIPLKKLHSVSLTVIDDDLLELSMTMSADEHIETLYSVSKKPEVERLLKNLSDLIPGVKIS